VPDAVLNGPKQGFRLPLGEWFRGELREYARDVLLDRRTVERGYFREGDVRSLLDRHAAGVQNHSQGIWTLLILELWHRQFVDVTTEARPARRPVQSQPR
jgi:asparagine synthase (glutamine-hydrolysing)